MTLPTVEIYSDLHCPWAYLANYRLRMIWPEYRNRLRIIWRSLSLEYINKQATPKPVLDVEIDLMAQIEPGLIARRWRRPDWQWPVAFWPALEALACAGGQSDEAAFEMSWAIRSAFFAEGRSPSLRHELLEIAAQVAQQSPLDLQRFEEDWDSGRYKATVIADSRRGWHELKVESSPTFVLPDGRRFSNPASGKADIDEERGLVRSYQPYQGDPLSFYRRMLDGAVPS